MNHIAYNNHLEFFREVSGWKYNMEYSRERGGKTTMILSQSTINDQDEIEYEFNSHLEINLE